MRHKEMKVLNSLINFNKSTEELQKLIKLIPWDSELTVELTDLTLSTILDRFLAGQITATQLEKGYADTF
jgi:hypothetical protein